MAYPSNIGIGDTKVLCKLRDGHGHREEVEGVPCPCQEAAQKHEPLMAVEFTEDNVRVFQFSLQRACCQRGTSPTRRKPPVKMPTLGGFKLVIRVAK